MDTHNNLNFKPKVPNGQNMKKKKKKSEIPNHNKTI